MELRENIGWVSTDGSYGVSDVVLFNSDEITDEQWDTIEGLSDPHRIEYVQAIMAGEPLDKWEN
jgi:hypothetical protein